jgi:hypothetical protein
MAVMSVVVIVPVGLLFVAIAGGSWRPEWCA